MDRGRSTRSRNSLADERVLQSARDPPARHADIEPSRKTVCAVVIGALLRYTPFVFVPRKGGQKERIAGESRSAPTRKACPAFIVFFGNRVIKIPDGRGSVSHAQRNKSPGAVSCLISTRVLC